MSYTNHSGGALGADQTWESLGKPYGVKTINWRPKHLDNMTLEDRMSMLDAVYEAAKVLKRPHQFKGVELVQRNWFQPHRAQAIYAVAYIISPGEQDSKGFVNETSKEIVAGGTGWAVEMAIQMEKPVYVYDMGNDHWHEWKPAFNKFFAHEGVPILTKSFAGIGSRSITPEGVFAIGEIYKKTFNYESGN